MQMEIRNEFSKMLKVIIPQDVGLSILKGTESVFTPPLPNRYNSLRT